MESIARRYTSPAAPPPLVSRPRPAAENRPVLRLRGGDPSGHAPLRLVSFGWGAVVPSYSRR